MDGMNIDWTLLSILFLLPLVLGLWSWVFKVANWGARLPKFPAPIYSLNLFYSYLAIDAVVSFTVCLSLYYLTYTGVPAAHSPSAWLIRWAGIALVVVFYATQFPVKLVVKLLWQRVFEPMKAKLPPRVTRWDGYGNDLLEPWIQGMQESAHWLGYCILCGAVLPYLGVLTVASALELVQAALGLPEMATRVLDLLLLISDWGGALLIVVLMLNLLFVSFTEGATE